jgi:hypothetical protein
MKQKTAEMKILRLCDHDTIERFPDFGVFCADCGREFKGFEIMIMMATCKKVIEYTGRADGVTKEDIKAHKAELKAQEKLQASCEHLHLTWDNTTRRVQCSDCRGILNGISLELLLKAECTNLREGESFNDYIEKLKKHNDNS